MKKNALLTCLFLVSIGGLTSCKSDKKTEQTEKKIQDETNTTKEITVGKNKITVNITSNPKSFVSEITLSVNGKVELQKSFNNISTFLDPSSFQNTNPIPVNNNIVFAIGGEYVEMGNFLYIQHENGKLIVKELSSDNASDENNSSTGPKIIKEIPIME